MKRRRLALTAPMALYGLLASPLFAQSRPVAAQPIQESRALDCQRIASDAANASDRDKRLYALALMSPNRCGRRALTGLLNVWRSAHPTELKLLLSVTAELADRRVLEGMMALLRDESRPTAVRLAAMDVLVRFAEPGAFISFTPDSTPGGMALGDYMHSSQTAGDQPIQAADRQAIGARLSQAASSMTSRQVRESALVVAELLRARRAAGNMLK